MKRSEIFLSLKERDQLDAWRKNFPGVVSRRVVGDLNVATLFNGEAKVLLWEVKNRLKLGNLNQLQQERRFNDGTVIRVSSSFGQDIVEIDTSRSIFVLGEGGACKITFLDMPLVVPPMKWYPDGIHTFPDGHREVEGVDYIRTHYTVENLSGNEYVEFTPCDTQKLMEDFGYGHGMAECHPFRFEDDTLPIRAVIPVVANDHCIYSLSTCGGEVYEYGTDKVGKYFLWKAFTEWSMLGPYAVFYNQLGGFSRTGLGYMQLGVKITDIAGKRLLCENYGHVKVDCCQKPDEQRPCVMRWESGEFGGYFIFLGDLHLYDVPNYPISGEWVATNFRHADTGMNIYMAPEIVGGCFPYTWRSTSNIKLAPWGDNFEKCAFTIQNISQVPYGGVLPCHWNGSVSVVDRCGKTDTLELLGCCDMMNAAHNPQGHPMQLEFTSFSMHCGEAQGFGPSGGCPPFTASLDGPGSLDITISSGSGFTYTAPNIFDGGCENGASVTVTDCCGSSASVTFQINCVGEEVDAFMRHVFEDHGSFSSWCGGTGCDKPHNFVYGKTIQGYYTTYDCDGGVNASHVYAGGYALCSQPEEGPCDIAAAPTNYCICGGYCDWPNPCNENHSCGVPEDPNGHSYWPTGPPPAHYDCDTVFDLRTPEMIAAGCCPTNPFTGLPFVGVE